MRITKKAMQIAVGVFIMALGTVWFADKAGLVTGGAAGISIAVREIAERMGASVPLFVTATIINIPLFVFTLIERGLKFAAASLYATVLFSVFLYLCEFIPNILYTGDDLFIAALMTGVFTGAGLGIALKCGATTGGTDMLAAIIQHKKPHLKTALIINAVDTVIILMGLFVFGPEKTLYAVLAVLVTTFVMNRILEGGRGAKAVMIFSAKAEEISSELMKNINRGNTAFDAKGMYTKAKREVLLSIVPEKELPYIKNTVALIDEKAFVVIADVREVLGEGFGAMDEKRIS